MRLLVITGSECGGQRLGYAIEAETIGDHRLGVIAGSQSYGGGKHLPMLLAGPIRAAIAG